jgi:hypothetical protein
MTCGHGAATGVSGGMENTSQREPGLSDQPSHMDLAAAIAAHGAHTPKELLRSPRSASVDARLAGRATSSAPSLGRPERRP